MKSLARAPMHVARRFRDGDRMLLVLSILFLSLVFFLSLSSCPLAQSSGLRPLRSLVHGCYVSAAESSELKHVQAATGTQRLDESAAKHQRMGDSKGAGPASDIKQGGRESNRTAAIKPSGESQRSGESNGTEANVYARPPSGRSSRPVKAPGREELMRSRMAVCLVGGARRFELTGPSIVENILRVYPNADLFLHSPLDDNSFKFSLLKMAPRVAWVRIFQPKHIPETESQARVLTADGSPSGIQGLLRYFSLVEGCLTMIKAYQSEQNFTYDWIVRTRVDGYWNGPLEPENFLPGQYVVPPGSSYGGLNDRMGIGDLNTSTVALSRLSLIPQLDSAGMSRLNSEMAFKAQLTTQGIPFHTNRMPFCIMSDRRYDYPPGRFSVPVAAIRSRGPLSGAKCRPCQPACRGACVAGVMPVLEQDWSWTEWRNGTMELCNATGAWEEGWERVFDRVAGEVHAGYRKKISRLELNDCVVEFKGLRKKAVKWEAPPAEDICGLGLTSQ